LVDLFDGWIKFHQAQDVVLGFDAKKLKLIDNNPGFKLRFGGKDYREKSGVVSLLKIGVCPISNPRLKKPLHDLQDLICLGQQ